MNNYMEIEGVAGPTSQDEVNQENQITSKMKPPTQMPNNVQSAGVKVEMSKIKQYNDENSVFLNEIFN